MRRPECACLMARASARTSWQSGTDTEGPAAKGHVRPILRPCPFNPRLHLCVRLELLSYDRHEVANYRIRCGSVVKRYSNLPLPRRNSCFKISDSGNFHDVGRPRDQGDSHTSLNKPERRKQFRNFLHHAREESSGMASSNDVIVETGGSRPGHQYKGFTGKRLQPSSYTLTLTSWNGNHESIREQRNAGDFKQRHRQPHDPNIQCAVLYLFQLRRCGQLAH